jgi:hypothetical protein
VRKFIQRLRGDVMNMLVSFIAADLVFLIIAAIAEAMLKSTEM